VSGAAPLVGVAEATAEGGVLAPPKRIRRTAPAPWKSAYHSSPVAGLTSRSTGLLAWAANVARLAGSGRPLVPARITQMQSRV
jgi:hypothetical protein